MGGGTELPEYVKTKHHVKNSLNHQLKLAFIPYYQILEKERERLKDTVLSSQQGRFDPEIFEYIARTNAVVKIRELQNQATFADEGVGIHHDIYINDFRLTYLIAEQNVKRYGIIAYFKNLYFNLLHKWF